MSDNRPNIIFILTDDHRWDALGYAGNAIIQTPVFDELAREGSYFSHAMVTTPICAVSRASLLTGLYERTHGYTFGAGFLKDTYKQVSYPEILKGEGYHTGFFGKLGVDIEDSETMFDELDFYDRNVQYRDRRGYIYKKIASDTVHLTRYTGYQAQEFIKNAPKDKPFCLSISFSAPHAHDPSPGQYYWQEKSDSLYENITFPPPDLSDERYFNMLPKEVREGFNRERWYWRFDSPVKYQRSMKGYYRMISEVDNEVGELRSLLEEKGFAENTIIIVMGDNGYYLGERQLAGKWLMHDVSLRVPLIIYDPRVKKNHHINDLVLNIDVPKTILTLAGASVPDHYQGISLNSYIKKGRDPQNKRDIALFEHLWNRPEIPSSEGVRTDRWKYFRYRNIDAEEELYDLANDPKEKNNLSGDPHYRDVLLPLREKCDSLITIYRASKF